MKEHESKSGNRLDSNMAAWSVERMDVRLADETVETTGGTMVGKLAERKVVWWVVWKVGSMAASLDEQLAAQMGSW